MTVNTPDLAVQPPIRKKRRPAPTFAAPQLSALQVAQPLSAPVREVTLDFSRVEKILAQGEEKAAANQEKADQRIKRRVQRQSTPEEISKIRAELRAQIPQPNIAKAIALGLEKAQSSETTTQIITTDNQPQAKQKQVGRLYSLLSQLNELASRTKDVSVLNKISLKIASIEQQISSLNLAEASSDAANTITISDEIAGENGQRIRTSLTLTPIPTDHQEDTPAPDNRRPLGADLYPTVNGGPNYHVYCTATGFINGQHFGTLKDDFPAGSDYGQAKQLGEERLDRMIDQLRSRLEQAAGVCNIDNAYTR